MPAGSGRPAEAASASASASASAAGPGSPTQHAARSPACRTEERAPTFYALPMRAARASAIGLGVALGFATLFGCSSGTSTRAASKPSTTPSAGAIVPTTTPKIGPTIEWTRLRNPIIVSPDHAVKDAALVAACNGKWFALFSAVDAQRHLADRHRALDRSAHAGRR